jgi:hemin uptake protein HemP
MNASFVDGRLRSDKIAEWIDHADWRTRLSDKARQENDRPAAVLLTGKMPRIISSRDLFGGRKLVIIRHEQDDYRLQMTAAGKLILTK